MGAITWTNELRFLVALALGFLIGLEREGIKTEHGRLYLGGVRTFPIVSMLGFGCGTLTALNFPALLPLGLAAISALTVVAYVSKTREGRVGATSEISLILTFVVGALSLLADIWIAMALGIVTTVLLSEKAELETQVEKLDRVGFLATIRFLLVTVIILPVIPDKDYTRFRLNPTHIWQIVIMVSSIGYVGYLLSLRFGKRAGLWISGLVGGVVSSTAATFSIGRVARRTPARSLEALQAVLLASSMLYLRLIVLIAILNPPLLTPLWWRLLLLALIGFAFARSVRTEHSVGNMEAEETQPQNPFEIRPSLLFGFLFVALSIITALSAEFFGNAGMLVLAAIVGVSDVDPFILSLVQGTGFSTAVIVGAVLLATMSNTIAKGAYFGFLAPSTKRATALRFGVWALLHLPLVFF